MPFRSLIYNDVGEDSDERIMEHIVAQERPDDFFEQHFDTIFEFKEESVHTVPSLKWISAYTITTCASEIVARVVKAEENIGLFKTGPMGPQWSFPGSDDDRIVEWCYTLLCELLPPGVHENTRYDAARTLGGLMTRHLDKYYATMFQSTRSVR